MDVLDFGLVACPRSCCSVSKNIVMGKKNSYRTNWPTFGKVTERKQRGPNFVARGVVSVSLYFGAVGICYVLFTLGQLSLPSL